MIIHLEADWGEAILERFALVIAQQSQHFALQLTWILQGAIEDYQPETVEGTPNPGYNKLFYNRCITLLSNIERCVVYGSPRSMELQRMYERGDITRDQYEHMKLEDRLNNARQITTHGANFRNLMQRMKETKISMIDLKLGREKGKEKENATTTAAAAAAAATTSTSTPSEPGSPSIAPSYSTEKGKQISKYGGTLLYKRRTRTAFYKPKRWKNRYFEIEERMLYCYNYHPSYGGELRRAMPLEGATVEEIEGKYPFMFVVKNHHFEFVIRAHNENEMFLWIRLIRGESEANALIPHMLSYDEVSEEKKEAGEDVTEKSSPNKLSRSQKARYEFFRNERDFVAAVCDVAEVLRFHEPSERKKLAPGLVSEVKLPPCGYVPLCKSTDIWRRVDAVIASETRVFNTNERCPMIYYFVAKRGEPVGSALEPRNPNLDVAEYLHTLFKVPDTEPDRLTSIGEHADELKLGESNEELDNKDKGEVKVEEKGEDYDDFELTMEDPIERDNSVWSEDKEDSKSSKSFLSTSIKGMKGNQQFQEFMKESFAKLPSKLATRMNRPEGKSNVKRGRMSYLDRNSAPLINVPIIDTPIKENANDDDSAADSLSLDGQSVISAGTGSIVLGDTIKKFEHYDGINIESIDRAKAIVSGGESWAEQSARMLQTAQNESKEKDDSTLHEIVTLMAKSNDDLRQEVFVMQMIHYFESVFVKANVHIWLKTYRILSTSKSTGLLEFLTDATSIDSLYKSDKFPKVGGLRAYFEQVYGPPTSKSFLAAQRNFIRSLAGYSLVAYLLGLKDRHNGNIMIDTRGHLIHIDFGFAFGMAPGHEWSFERAPFKLTKDYIDVMGGPHSEGFKEFQKLFVNGFKAARSNSLTALGLVEIMMYKSNYPCFSGTRYGGGVSLKKFEKRLMLDVPDNKVETKAKRLIKASIEHTGTKLYDIFQYHSNGYAY
jgi:phosphatidylinositol 4-kinase